MMGALLVLVAQAWVGRPTVLGHLQFTGSPLVAGFGLVLFTALLAFGISALHGGIWQIRHKRRAPALLRVAEYSFTALAIVGTAVAILIEANSWSLLDRLRQILCYRATAILD
jgi:heme A synthase